MSVAAAGRALQRAQWRAWYSFLSWYSSRAGARFSCMNWGYDDGRALVDEGAGPERYPLQLYAALVEGVPLEGKVLVDVSCGRGGGLAYLARAHQPARAVGLDFTPAHVEVCRGTVQREVPSLELEVGDAEALPLPDASADVLLSVEASHCYGSYARFLDEARRVLRPGGVLLWTDFAPRQKDRELSRLARDRFVVDTERDITAHVLSAMEKDAPRRIEIIERHSARLLRPVFRNFAAADERCDTVRRFRSGDHVYFLRRLRCPGVDP